MMNTEGVNNQNKSEASPPDAETELRSAVRGRPAASRSVGVCSVFLLPAALKFG